MSTYIPHEQPYYLNNYLPFIYKYILIYKNPYTGMGAYAQKKTQAGLVSGPQYYIIYYIMLTLQE